MKKGQKILSLILVLSLLLSSLVFTVGAEEESSNNIDDYIDEDVELFTPTANYISLTEANASTYLTALIAEDAETTSIGHSAIYGGNNLNAYFVSSEGYDDYLMFIPADTAVQNKKVTDHVQLNTHVDEVIRYDSENPSYFVFEMDVTTESGVLPIFYQMVSRNSDGVKDDSGNTVSNWGDAYKPSSTANSLYMTMTPGVFHHLTFVGDVDNNLMYVYIDDQLVATQTNGVTSAALHSYYKNSGAALKIEGFRIQLNNGIALSNNMSLCVKNFCDRVLTGTESDNLSSYVGLPTLQGWTGNRYESLSDDKLPPIISVNGVGYNNTVDATAALNLYNTGNVATIERSVLSGDITVDCDAAIYVYSADVSLLAGEHTTLTKVDGSTYQSTLHSLKYSNKLVAENPTDNLVDYLKYDIDGNIISNIKLVHAGLTDGANADIMQSDKGNYYIYAYDNSENPYPDGDDYHFYMNAEIPHTSSNALEGHDFIVFDFDIFAESELINVYNAFVPRDLTNDTPLSATAFYLTSNLDGTMNGSTDIEIESGIWNHFTFVGEIATGTAYVYINNTLVKTLTNGLYKKSTNDAGETVALDGSNNQYTLDNVTINMFRCMQISNTNKSGQTLTQNMSVGADNFNARFVDGDATLVAGMETLDSWVTNLYGNGYQYPELPPIATVDGVNYYDTLSLTEALTDTDYTTTKKTVVFSRDFVGTVNVSCRAEIITKGVNGNITYSDRVWTKTTQDSYGKDVVEVYYVETEDTPAYTETWTEDVTEAFDNQKLTSATTDTIIAAIKSSKDNNKYSSHSFANSDVSYIAQQLESYTADSDGIYTATYGDEYLLDNGAQTHTLGMGSASLASDVTLGTASATVSSSFDWSSGNTITTDFSCPVTVDQYYFSFEFDIAYSGTLDTSKTLPLTFTFGTTAFDVELTSLLDEKAEGEFVHVTVIGTISVDTQISRSLDISSSWGSYTASNVTASADNTYTLQYDVYANGAKANSVSNTLSGKVSEWSNVKITNNGNSIAVDNVFASTECVTKTYTYTESIAGDADWNSNTAISNTTSAVASNQVTSAEIAATTASSDNSSSVTLDDTLESGNVSYDESALPESVVTGTTEEVKVGTEEKTEEIPAVNTPIACVNGTLYYAEDEDELREILENTDGDTEVLEVTILREPDTAYTIGANAVIDTNGLSSNVFAYDASKEFATTTVNGVTTVIVVGETTILANLNGADYYDLSELQTALTLAKSAELVFYSQPASALKITCPAVITSNGFTDVYTVDEYVYAVSETDGVITVSEHTETPTIRLIMNGVEIINEAVKYGTDIAEHLKASGVVSAAVGVDGKIYTDITYSSTVDAYLADGKPTGRITEDVTYTATYSSEWTEDFIVVKNDGTIASLSSYDANTLLSYFANSSTEAIILGEDIVLDETGTRSLTSGGDASLYLNGHKLTYDAPTGNSGVHLWVASGSGNYSFYGPGTIESTTMNYTQGIIFSNYGYTGNIKFQDLTMNVSHSVAQLRGGNLEVLNCDINAYVPTTNGSSSTVSLAGLFTLDEDTGTSYSTTESSIIISQSDIDFRYYEVDSRYSARTLDVPLIYHKIVTTDGATDPKTTVLIDNSYIKAQGSIVKSYHTANSAAAPDSSNMKLWINESTILAKSITELDIKSGSVIFYENVRTNVKNVAAVSFVSTLIHTKSSDGLLPYLYTSYDYATVNWSNGTTEYWAAGSTPTNSDCRFDNVETVEAGKSYTFTATAASAPFKLYANLTLADVIGFNIYIPATVNVSAVYLDGALAEKCIKDGSDTTYVAVAGAECYAYTVTLDPHISAKHFTLVVVLDDGTHVSRTLSVGTYATALYSSINGKTTTYAVKNKALLSVALSYVEQATLYSGYTLDMTGIASILSGVGITSFSATATTTDTSAISAYLAGASINVKDTCAFKFTVADGADIQDLKFYIGDEEKEYTVSDDGSYVELSLRAYEMAKMITITVGGNEGTYDLYTYYSALNAKAGTSGTEACECNQALQLIKALYTYATVADQYTTTTTD